MTITLGSFLLLFFLTSYAKGQYDPSKCVDGSYDEVVVTEDFETNDNTWSNMQISELKSTESFLGPYGKDNAQTHKSYADMSVEAKYVTVEFFFYELDQWAEEDYIKVQVGSAVMEVRNFGVNEGNSHSVTYEDIVKGDVTLSREIVGGASEMEAIEDSNTKERLDQVFKITMTIPPAYFANGRLTIGFEFCLITDISSASGGLDKFNITEHFDCTTEAPTPAVTPAPTLTGSPCEPLISFEDFGNIGNCDAANWNNGISDTYGTNTDIGCFLGRYGGTMGDVDGSTAGPWRMFDVPTDSPSITISFKFLETDQWENRNIVFIDIDDRYRLNMGRMNENDADQNDHFEYTDPTTGIIVVRNSISETYNMAFSEHADEIHEVTITVPKSVYVNNGKLMVRFVFLFTEDLDDESFGIDDFTVTRYCEANASTRPPTDAPIDPPTDLPTDPPTNPPNDPPTDQPTSSTAGTNGDPHFSTWAGEKYDFHGRCDLVLLENHGFKNNLGMDIHIRTKKMRSWSYISNAVLRIGEDTFEVMGGKDGSQYWINGIVGKRIEENNVLLPVSLSGFPITFSLGLKNQHEYYIDLGNQEMIVMKTWNDLVRVDVIGGTVEGFGDSRGLMGKYGSGEHLARDNVSVLKDNDEFGKEWQVRKNEAKLFHNLEGPQHPQLCELPSAVEVRRRLRQSLVSQEEAEIACSRVSESDRELCIFDVMATNDVNISGAY